MYSFRLETFFERVRQIYDVSRVNYTMIQDKLAEEEERFRKSQSSTLLTYQGKQERKTAWQERRAELLAELHALVADTQTQFREVRNQVEVLYRDKYGINSGMLDQNTLELLKSGILTNRELAQISEKYSDNGTMLRMIAKYAEERLEKDKHNTELRELVAVISHRGNPHLDAMDALIYTAEQGLRDDRTLSDPINSRLFDKTYESLVAQYGDICTRSEGGQA